MIEDESVKNSSVEPPFKSRRHNGPNIMIARKLKRTFARMAPSEEEIDVDGVINRSNEPLAKRRAVSIANISTCFQNVDMNAKDQLTKIQDNGDNEDAPLGNNPVEEFIPEDIFDGPFGMNEEEEMIAKEVIDFNSSSSWWYETEEYEDSDDLNQSNTSNDAAKPAVFLSLYADQYCSDSDDSDYDPWLCEKESIKLQSLSQGVVNNSSPPESTTTTLPESTTITSPANLKDLQNDSTKVQESSEMLDQSNLIQPSMGVTNKPVPVANKPVPVINKPVPVANKPVPVLNKPVPPLQQLRKPADTTTIPKHSHVRDLLTELDDSVIKSWKKSVELVKRQNAVRKRSPVKRPSIADLYPDYGIIWESESDDNALREKQSLWIRRV
jgi:hypothetical protein